ncbi:MAG: 5-oxoprolinase, partial [FCB group bacterium]|nr:5-oxoprolinase [FCB group bacterium]
HTLICFGGAAPQHAGAIAQALGMKKIIIHPLSGVLSAYGIAAADKIERGVAAIMRPFKQEFYPRLCETSTTLLDQTQKRLGKIGPDTPVHRKVFLDLRPLGSDTYLTVPIGERESLLSYREIVRTFLARYRKRFGFYPEENRIEGVNMRVEISVPGTILVETPSDIEERIVNERQVWKRQPVYFDGKNYETPVIRHGDLVSGNTIDGPALIVDDHYTTVVDPGFRARVNEYGHLVLESKAVRVEKVTAKRDPVMLEIFNHLFMSIAEQMGYTLVNTAHSVNIKERLDFSCALFDRDGNLVANAPHIPVHLGAMGESVKYIARSNAGKIHPGDVFVTNNPHHGGSHLPDVTVVSPFFTKDGELVFFVASRGHHADIGGITPGSMPPFGKTLAEEGVVIDNFLLVSQNRFREREIRDLLLSGPYPARNIAERLSDLRAQVAANNKGLLELERLVENYTWPVVLAYMGHVQDNAAEALTEALGKFVKDKPVFKSVFRDFMDDGSVINVSLTIERGKNPPESHRMLIDFSETSPEKENNLNAPVAVTKAAVLYVLRTLIDQDIPLNSGCFRAVEIRIPAGSLLNPSPGAAVVGGNVETSQRIVDVLLGALGVSAASQGTMNNFLFGRPDDSGAQYYETVAGGAGATEGHRGASAVQVHMTNTRITDPEVLEYRRFGWRTLKSGKGPAVGDAGRAVTEWNGQSAFWNR